MAISSDTLVGLTLALAVMACLGIWVGPLLAGWGT